MTAAFRIVPELVVASLDRAAQMLSDQFGFVPVGAGRMVLGSQHIRLTEVPGRVFHGPGPIDHLALRVQNTDDACRAAIASGAQLAADTPDGPREIAAFWSHGIRYCLFDGPGGARFEFCARMPVAAQGAVVEGHDHIGLCCRDLAASVAFYRGLGLAPVFATTLHTPAGPLGVCFMQRGGSVIELYSPPEAQVAPTRPPGPWCALWFEGAGGDAPLTGPDGESVQFSAN